MIGWRSRKRERSRHGNLRRESRYGKWVVGNRWLLLAIALATTVLTGSGLRKLAFDNNYRIFFSDENPQLQAFDELQRKYTKIDNVLFAVGARDGQVFTAEIMDGIEKLTAEAWTLPYVLRVDAVTNYQHTIATDDDLVVADLVEGAGFLSKDELAAAREVSLGEPSLAGFLVSDDARFAGVNVTFQMPEKSMDEVPTAVRAARELAARIEAEYPVEIHLTGMVMLNNAFFESSLHDMGTLLPIMYLIILLVTYLLVRSVSATFGTLLVLLLSVVTAMGTAGWLGIGLSPPSSAAPTIIMTLAVADSIHILITLLGLMRVGSTKREAIVESLRQNLQPVILTSVTTAVGFLSLNFSDAPPFAHLGNITAIGVVAALFYSVTFFPAFLAVVPLRPRRSLSEFGGAMGRLSRFVTTRSRPILWGSALISLTLLPFLAANEMNDDFVKYFEKGTTFRTDIDETTRNLTGVYQLQYSLDSGNNNGVSDPEFLAKVDAFTNWLRSQPEVRHVSSITDTFKRLNRNLHGDDPGFYRLPESRELAAQYLLLYELSLPYGLDLNNQLSVDKSETQIVATLENLTSRELRDVASRGETWLKRNVGLTSTGIGPAIMFAFISDRNIRGMLTGTFLAVLVISAVLLFALRSVRLGLLSLVPNLLPAALAFGLWGILRGEVNMAVSMVSGMTLGIVVDDTVHFLTKYLRARREKGLNATDAVHYAFSQVGRAIVVTTVVLVAGFGVLAQSSFAMNSYMATLTVIAIIFALVADFLLLPALLLAVDRGTSRATVAAPAGTGIEAPATV